MDYNEIFLLADSVRAWKKKILEEKGETEGTVVS